MLLAAHRPAAVCIMLALTPFMPVAHATNKRLVVADFVYVDTSGEQRDQAAAHGDRMRSFMLALRHDLASYTPVLTPQCGTATCTTDSADLTEVSKKDGADLLLLGGVHKVSTLVQWANITLADLRTGRPMLDRTFTFRGDDDQAWQHAEIFIAQEIGAVLPNQAMPAPIRIVVFPFELDDFSAGAAAGATNPVDKGQTEAATSAARTLLGQSGRYVIVMDAATTHTLRDCNGCEAALARQAGAQQSFLGIVRRISQTEYVLRFTIRDAATGKILAAADSGLRIGAAYSWGRGTRQLIADNLLPG